MCNQDNSGNRSVLERLSWELKKCTACKFVYLQNPPAYEALRESLSWQKSWIEEKKRRRDEEPVLHKIQDIAHSIFKPKRRDKLTTLVGKYVRQGYLLDVGCGDGHRSKPLSKQLITFGVEIEEEAARKADELFAKRGGLAVCAPAVDGINEFADEFFDGAIMYAYLEHEIQPLDILERVNKKLRRGGKLIIKVPNYGCINRRVRGIKWCGFRFPDHVNYFTPRTLSLALHRTGYLIEKFGILDRFPLSDNMWLVAKRTYQ